MRWYGLEKSNRKEVVVRLYSFTKKNCEKSAFLVGKSRKVEEVFVGKSSVQNTLPLYQFAGIG
jgi:hypothetical protein